MSVFAIVILSIIASLYRSGHEGFGGSINDPDDGKAVAGTIFTAVVVYAVRHRCTTTGSNCVQKSSGLTLSYRCS